MQPAFAFGLFHAIREWNPSNTCASAVFASVWSTNSIISHIRSINICPFVVLCLVSASVVVARADLDEGMTHHSISPVHQQVAAQSGGYPG